MALHVECNKDRWNHVSPSCSLEPHMADEPLFQRGGSTVKTWWCTVFWFWVQTSQHPNKCPKCLVAHSQVCTVLWKETFYHFLAKLTERSCQPLHQCGQIYQASAGSIRPKEIDNQFRNCHKKGRGHRKGIPLQLAINSRGAQDHTMIIRIFATAQEIMASTLAGEKRIESQSMFLYMMDDICMSLPAHRLISTTLSKRTKFVLA